MRRYCIPWIKFQIRWRYYFYAWLRRIIRPHQLSCTEKENILWQFTFGCSLFEENIVLPRSIMHLIYINACAYGCSYAFALDQQMFECPPNIPNNYGPFQKLQTFNTKNIGTVSRAYCVKSGRIERNGSTLKELISKCMTLQKFDNVLIVCILDL